MNYKKILTLIIILTFALLNKAFANDIAPETTPVFAPNNETTQTSGNAPTDQSTKLEAYSLKEGYNKYTNSAYGYEIVLLNNLVLNEDIVNVESSFKSDWLVVDVLYDNFYNDVYNNKQTLINYGNKGIEKNTDFKITAEYNHEFNGLPGHITLYEREKINGNALDRNYYAMITFARTYKELITVFIKSANPVYIDYIMPEFKLIEKTGTIKQDAVFTPYVKNYDEKTKEFYDKYFVNSEKTTFGIFEPTYPDFPYKLQQMEDMLEYEFPVVLMYNSFQKPYKTDLMNQAKLDNRIVEYGIYTTDLVDGKEKDVTLEILEGKYDDYLDHLAQSFNEYDYPVLFRLNNEMNGEWVWYSSHIIGKDTDLFIECWRYIYDRFKEQGVDNLIWVWNPNEKSFPNFAYNHYLNYYPGNEYVDVVGLTAYNTGNYYKGEIWRSFQEAYDHFYYDYTRHFNHPMMITEFSGASAGGNKAAWFDDMFTKIKNYDRIKIAVLWNGQDYDMSKPEKTVSRNYRLDLETDVINSVRGGLKKWTY